MNKSAAVTGIAKGLLLNLLTSGPKKVRCAEEKEMVENVSIC